MRKKEISKEQLILVEAALKEIGPAAHQYGVRLIEEIERLHKEVERLHEARKDTITALTKEAMGFYSQLQEERDKSKRRRGGKKVSK